MNQSAQPIEVDAFLASLRDRTAHGVATVAIEGGELPISVHLQESSTLIFTFSGAVHRNHYSLPRFSALNLHDYVSASVIALADPSLARSDDLPLAWYAGHAGFELQQILPDILRRMIDSLGATRVAFVGSSGGGFAALYYSWRTPDSIAIVSNPQTNLDRYFPAHRRKYIPACWPGLETDTPLSSVIEADLGPLYASQCNNTLIYLQVASDFFHIARHFAPFVETLPGMYAERLIVRMNNWGRQGHQPVPASIWIPWINAALSAPETTAESIQKTWAEQNPHDVPQLGSLVSPQSRDERIAAELARTATSALLTPRSSEMDRY